MHLRQLFNSGDLESNHPVFLVQRPELEALSVQISHLSESRFQGFIPGGGGGGGGECQSTCQLCMIRGDHYC